MASCSMVDPLISVLDLRNCWRPRSHHPTRYLAVESRPILEARYAARLPWNKQSARAGPPPCIWRCVPIHDLLGLLDGHLVAPQDAEHVNQDGLTGPGFLLIPTERSWPRRLAAKARSTSRHGSASLGSDFGGSFDVLVETVERAGASSGLHFPQVRANSGKLLAA